MSGIPIAPEIKEAREKEMSDTMNIKKMWSGRFLLCLCAAVALVIFTGIVAYLMVKTEDAKSMSIALNMISNVIVSVVTFYFTKSMMQAKE